MKLLVFGRSFVNSAKKLEKPTQRRLNDILDLISKDAFQATLHTKPLTGKLKGFYS